jgi:hypothetical protein
MAAYSFVLDSFDIGETRSVIDDTDYVSWTLAVIPQGGQVVPRTLTKSMGSINIGTHIVNLAFNNIAVNPTDTVILNYLIVNCGKSSRVDVEAALESIGPALITAGSALGVPQLASAMQALPSWLPNKLHSVSGDRCDGPVAAEQDNFSGDGLVAIVPPLPPAAFSQGTGNPGIDSATGCGKNSYYYVNWHIVGATTLVNAVIDLNGTWASGGVPGPIISVDGNSISVDMSSYKRPTATGSIVDSSDITVAFPDDKTYTGKLQPPGTIQWSNNSTWTKV